jgi:acetyl esterase
VTHIEYAATTHGFLNFCGIMSAGDHAIELIAEDLRLVREMAPALQ